MAFVRETTQKPATRPPRGGAAVQFTVNPLAFIDPGWTLIFAMGMLR
jgi:hypothetical protein